MDGQQAGSIVAGTGGIKIRFAPPSWNTGKSRATRVYYLVFGGFHAAYLSHSLRKTKNRTSPLRKSDLPNG